MRSQIYIGRCDVASIASNISSLSPCVIDNPIFISLSSQHTIPRVSKPYGVMTHSGQWSVGMVFAILTCVG